ncbi:hypothetical protein [Janthinobacterium fluminis]|uniref:Uncharacterized protein n=1 Tax=Janthinobacterium fluminis TaxID=2987524 RepID=A0ABT5K2A7_9BURK|nr:hypothetical protein [Janthinobacterium fluminis]MDC8759049.1 hypothetical protein [Janthinobacterium fluminis]
MMSDYADVLQARMSDVACRTCAGSGKLAVLAKHNLVHLVEDMVEALDAISAHAAGQTTKCLALDMKL